MIPLYTKYITPAGYGTLDLIETIMSAAAILVSMGISEGMTRFYYAEKDEDTRNQIISTIILGFSFVGIGVTGLLEAGSGYATQLIWGEMSYHYYFQVALASLWFSMLCEITFSYLRMKYLAKQFVVVTLLQVVLALTLNIYFIVVIQIDILGVLYSTLISQGLVAVVLSALILRKVGIQVSWPILRKLISFGAPLGPARIALLLGFASNRFALIWLSPAAPAVALAQVGLL
ncbi:MAG TPA: oligosaccharide flippase family protein, partial [Nitrospira sp.]|nr:oligosaccharide flippase family protein [Nitrospira sp.]